MQPISETPITFNHKNSSTRDELVSIGHVITPPHQTLKGTLFNPRPLEKSQTSYLIKIKRVYVRGLRLCDVMAVGVIAIAVVACISEADTVEVVSCRCCGAAEDDDVSGSVAIAPGAI
jgi:hypothetical protein